MSYRQFDNMLILTVIYHADLMQLILQKQLIRLLN